MSADDPETAIPFNLSTISVPSANNGRIMNARGQESLQSYLVDASGSIDFPVLGKLQVGGLSRSELMQLLEGKISKYIKQSHHQHSVDEFQGFGSRRGEPAGNLSREFGQGDPDRSPQYGQGFDDLRQKGQYFDYQGGQWGEIVQQGRYHESRLHSFSLLLFGPE